jgi:hypothetical protein
MSLRWWAVCLCVGLLCSAARSAEPDNPLRNARAGDWVVYKAVMKGETLMFQKMTVTAKDDKEATVEVVRTVFGTKLPGETFKVDLSKAYDPALQPINPDPNNIDLKIEQLDTGKETIKLGDKKYDCTWRKVKLTGSSMGVGINAECKVWVSKDAPMLGLVKLDYKAKEGEATMTLEDHGRGK